MFQENAPRGRRTASRPRPPAAQPLASGRRRCYKKSVEIRYYLDADTGQPHVYRHGVTE